MHGRNYGQQIHSWVWILGHRSWLEIWICVYSANSWWLKSLIYMKGGHRGRRGEVWEWSAFRGWVEEEEPKAEPGKELSGRWREDQDCCRIFTSRMDPWGADVPLPLLPVPFPFLLWVPQEQRNYVLSLYKILSCGWHPPLWQTLSLSDLMSMKHHTSFGLLVLCPEKGLLFSLGI